MASTWGTSWGTSWLTSWDGGGGTTPPVVTPPYPGPAGKAKKTRRKIEIDGQIFNLTEDELQAALQTVLRREVKDAPKAIQKPAKALQRAVQAIPAPARPTYPSAPAFDSLWDHFMRRGEHEAATAARAAAMEMEIEADDADVFQLLRMIDDA